MEKIIVTEEQAKVIDDFLAEAIEEGYPVNYVLSELCLNSRLMSVSVISLARISSGEEYEVKREFKIGDIVKNGYSEVAEVVSDSYKETPFTRGVNYVNSSSNGFKLVCAVENRDDLKGE